MLLMLGMTILNFFIWILFDYCSFYLIAKVKFKNRDLVLLSYFIASFALSVINLWFSAIASIIQVLVFYLWFKNRNSRQLILGSALIVAIIDVFGDILVNIFQISSADTLLGIFTTEFMNLGLLIIFFVLAFYNQNRLHSLLVSKTDRVFLTLLGYFYFSIQIFSIIILIKGSKQVIITSLFIILILQVIFVTVAFYYNSLLNKKILNIERQKQLQVYIKNIENYAGYLESKEDGLRKFRHDIQNLLNSAALNQDTAKLSSYIETYFKENFFEQYNDLNHLQVKPLKNLLLTKMATMINYKINYRFECMNVINETPKNVNIFDLVRIIGIGLDNSIEASKLLGNKSQIEIMFFNNDKSLEVEIKNRVKDYIVDIDKIQMQGYTTKKNHNGFGISNVKEIIAQILICL